jgi:hypothetical protein
VPTRDQFAQLTHILSTLDAQGPNGGFVQQGSESLIAEIIHDGESKHYLWMNPDHQRPFPGSILNLISWLQSFKPVGAAPLTLRELSSDPICPRSSFQPLQPVSASLFGVALMTPCAAARP